jgi:hypothetical protein
VPVFAVPYVIACRIALHRIARILKSPQRPSRAKKMV